MKKKNGFTLIELLAIIVILAIIAVITVPIILNIIENSKMGAVKDSAYGYKDSVNKWYVSKLTEDPNYVLNDGTYSVSELGATVEGKQPGSNSWVTISKTNVTDGCLQFDEYKVEITNGEVGEASVGECEEAVPPCPGPNCVYAYYTEPKENGYYGEVLNGYETDYTTLNKDIFLGHILDKDGKITRIFACILKDGEPICIEGSDGSKYEKNKEILREVFDGYTIYTSEAMRNNAKSNGCYFDVAGSGYYSGSLISNCRFNYIDDYDYSEIQISDGGDAHTSGYMKSCDAGGICVQY